MSIFSKLKMSKYTSLVLIFCASYFGCNTTEPSNDYDFGIYLLRDTTLTTSDVKEISLKSLIVQDEPLINITDIVEYNWEYHIIILTSEAFERFGKVEGKIKSTDGLPFIFIAEGQKIYLGNIYPAYSSYIHIDLPFITVAPFTEMRMARAPSQEVEDKRNDDRIYSVLQEYDKIVQ